MIQELNFLNLAENPFLDNEDNDLFCKEVFSLLATTENKIQLQGGNDKEIIQRSIQLSKETIDHIKVTPKLGRLLVYREHEIEAVLIHVNEIFSNLDKVLDLTKYSSGYGDFILVGEDLDFGLCIERTEYFHEFTVWGLLMK
ncbi:hypothetical protein AB1K83_04130 [Sporosarcina sp. 179-K 3D1 HS]|uniref:YxiF family protein n=1 Tax=Sporosarcina sp. 179-K 3D1 HS TaxID=3232169 RepID=UPI0039A1B1FA